MVNLLAAIILTIITDPGSIPADTEWDISDNSAAHACNHSDSKSEATRHRDDFINPTIERDMADPKDPSHFDYRFIRTKAGPVY